MVVLETAYFTSKPILLTQNIDIKSQKYKEHVNKTLGAVSFAARRCTCIFSVECHDLLETAYFTSKPILLTKNIDKKSQK